MRTGGLARALVVCDGSAVNENGRCSVSFAKAGLMLTL